MTTWSGGRGISHGMEDFVEFATAAVPRLRRIRRQEAVFSYASRTLVNTYIASRRSKRSGEIVTDVVPEHMAMPDSPETRLVVMAALAILAPRARAVVVLRYWADMSVEQVAEVLGCSAGTVKSQCARALEKMRPVLEGVGRHG
jgi:RNA polymerase sigma factor (sigma-70 family)